MGLVLRNIKAFRRCLQLPSLCLLNTMASVNNRKFTICVEGNIGSGKSTMLEYFKDNVDVEVCKEPVDKWRDIGGGNLFDLMYKDPNRWSYTFQTYTLLTMMQIHQKEQVTYHRLLERSVYSAVYIFVENLLRSGKLSKLEYLIHHEWFDWLKKVQTPIVDLFVYIRTSPEECLRRVKARGRSEEEGLPLELLQQVHERYEEWLVEESKFDIPAPVVIKNVKPGSCNLEALAEEIYEMRCRVELELSKVIDGDKSVEEMIQYYYEKSDSIFNRNLCYERKLQNQN